MQTRAPFTVNGTFTIVPQNGWASGQAAYAFFGDTNNSVIVTFGGDMIWSSYNGVGIKVGFPSITAVFFDTAGIADFKKGVKQSGAYGSTYHSDVTPAAVSVANGGTIDFLDFSGMLVMTNQTNGRTGIWLCGGASTNLIGTSDGVLSGMGSLAVNGLGYRWTNNTGGTISVGFEITRTRTRS